MFSGKNVIQDDFGLVITETKVSGSTASNEDEPNYPIEDSKDTGSHGVNPWR